MRDRRNRAAVAKLLAALRETGVTPFVGAGMSMPLGYPGWVEFLTASAGLAGVDVATDLAHRRYEQAAEALAARKGRTWLDARIRRTYGKPPAGQRGDAVRALPRLARGAVITTNFDGVLEEVFRDAGRPFEYEIWGGRPAISAKALAEDRHVLIKIHGDARDAEGRVLTRDEYERHYGSMRTPVARALLHIVAARPLLFLGCRIENDRYLGLLGRAAPRGRFTHFAVVPAERGARWLRSRKEYLKKLGIEPIWYEAGRFEEIARFLHYVAGTAGHAETEGERHRAAIAYLETLLRQSRDVDRSINLLIGNTELFTVTGLSAEYLRVAPPVMRLAEKHGRYCKALLIANNCASCVARDDREFAKWIRRCERLARRCRRSGPLEDYAYNAALAAERSDPSKARRLYRRLTGRRRNSRAVAALRRWAAFEVRSGRRRRALQLLRRAVRRAGKFPLHQARAYNELGGLLWDRGDDVRSERAYRAALALFERLENADGQGAALTGLGNVAIDRKEWRRAERLFARALHYAQLAHNTALVSIIRGCQAEALFREGRFLRGRAKERIRAKFVEADEHLADLLAQERRPRLRAHLRTQRALLIARLEHPRKALKELHAAARILRRYGDDAWLSTNYSHRSWILSDSGQIRHAIRAEEQALRIAEEIEFQAGISMSKQFLADLRSR